MSARRPQGSRQTTRWISREFSELFADAVRCRPAPDAAAPAFDVLIVGSGYGGAVAAAELAGCRDAAGRALSVCVLERGREYLPGAFPSRLAELPTQLRGRFLGRRFGGEGLFDLRGDGDLGIVVANGLGGGSLINAGVMEIPGPEVFDARWPESLRGAKEQDGWFLEARTMLGAAHGEIPNDIGLHAAHRGALPAKAQVLRTLAPRSFRKAAITIAMTDTRTAAGVALSACKRCGDCATGCNHGAKESLDTNLLVDAHRRGALIYCGATVLRLQRSTTCPELWSVLVTHTDPKMRRRETGPRWIAARKLILAAGSLGSTEILLRSQREAPELSFSPRLGQGFSGNGDSISFGYGYGEHARANAVADEDQPPEAREVGPTITGIVDTRVEIGKNGPQQRIVIEEMAVPGALRRAAEEVITTADALHALGECDREPHADGHPAPDPYAVHRERIRDMSLFAAMGDDGASGVLRLGACADGEVPDGEIDIVWPGARTLPLLDAQLDHIARLARDAGYRGRTLPNPFWRFLPDSMAAMIGDGRAPPVSVHPLGGCPMGATAADGVVDEYGRVFDPEADATQPFHDGLLVLDGAIVPCALATNPALTIAALALRSVRTLRDTYWRWTRAAVAMPPAVARPRLTDTGACARAAQTGHTVVGVTERLAGAVTLADAQGIERDCWVELTLSYEPLRLRDLFEPDADGRLSRAHLGVGGPQSSGRLRIFLREEWDRLRVRALSTAEREHAEACAARSYALDGTLTILQREASRPCMRTLRALRAWWCNRGFRDLAQGALEGFRKWRRGDLQRRGGWKDLILGPVRLASRAGEVRRFDYLLRIGAELACPDGADTTSVRFDAPASLAGAAIEGCKRISYTRPGNPWRQLQELELGGLAGVLRGEPPPTLTLDPQYLAERGHPLLRIEAQRDHVEALADLASLAAYMLRMLLSIHVWNARKPDPPRHRAIRRLPGRLPGLPAPEIHWLDVDRLDGARVRIRLARYRRRGAQPRSAPRPPVLLIHGYSASGTTFAHPKLDPGLARHLAQAGREVWVVDLRSSAGMPTAAHPWTFEQVALADIPAAVDLVWRLGGEHRIDVLAHCMGAAMLSMAVLSADKTPDEIAELLARGSSDGDRFRAQRRALPDRIRRVVLSQNGPAMVMSQQNIFRGYVMSYFEQVFGPLPYAFRPEPEQGLAADLFDRFLGSLPYPDDELRLENPWQPWRRTEHLATRHRMDALYGRTFSLKNMSREVLDRIDDFFGPLNLETVAQVIHFSQLRTIASRSGRNRFVTPVSLHSCWRFPTLSLHGSDNGLADIATAHHVQALLHGAGRHCEVVRLPGQGHQDCLIGTRSRETFAEIESFLERPDDDPRFAPPAPAEACIAQAAWLGPMLTPGSGGAVHVGLGACPRLGRPIALCILPVERGAEGWQHRRLVQALGLAESDLRLSLCPDTDWLSVELPDWTRRVRHVALLLVYAQPVHATVPQHSNTAPTIAGAVERALRQARTDAAAGVLDLAWTQPESGLRLALGSCMYPAGIFNEEPGHESWRRLNAELDRGEGPQLLMLTGDQIYVDATAGLFDPAHADDRYRKPYEAWLRDAQVRDAVRRCGVLTMLDDHEIEDNWEPVPGEPGNAAFDASARLLHEGVRHFRRYQRPGDGGGPLWRTHAAGGAYLFILDTRTEREPRSSASPGVPMIGEAQWQALQRWLLATPRDAPKLVVSPAALLPRHRDAVRATLAFGRCDAGEHACLRSDGWDGYPGTLQRLLALIADAQIPRIVFLSGDEHLGLHVRARVRGPGEARKGVLFHSIHTPGLNTPYRFANAAAREFILREGFRFEVAGRGSYRCALSTSVIEGAGFTLLSLSEDDGRWTLHCRFDAPGARDPARELVIAL